MKHYITGDDIIITFCTPLCIDCATYIREVAEYIETIEHKGEIAMKYSFGKAGVPNQFVGMHGVICLPAATVFGKVGTELHVPRKFHLAG